MPPRGGVAFRSEGPPKGNAAPTANRDGANKRIPKLGASPNKYERHPGSSTGKKPGQQKDVHRLVRLWPRQLGRLYERRTGGGILPDDDTGRRHAAIMLDQLVQGPNGHCEAAAFLNEFCPWMAPAEHADAIDRAFGERKFWTPTSLGDALGLTWEEHDDCEITAIRPAGATDAEMAAVRKMKNTSAKREKRQQEKPPRKKEPLPLIRAKIIADVLKPGEQRTVKDLCTVVKKRIRFVKKKGDVLKAVVHDAVKCGIARGFLRKHVEPGPRGPVAWITKISDGKCDRNRGTNPPCPPLRSAGCGQEFPTVGKTCPQVRVLIIEEGLSTGGVAAAGSGSEDIWFTGEWLPDGGREAQAPPSASDAAVDLQKKTKKTFIDKKKEDCLFCLEGEGTDFLSLLCPCPDFGGGQP